METDDATLKQQFQLLQEQQQKKLQKRKQRKDELAKQSLSVPSDKSFGIEDDLGLQVTDQPPEGSFVSEELVEHLNDQIREKKDENGRLFKLLSERDFEIKQLKKKRQEDRAALAGTGGVTNEAAASKIVELSKKIREMTSELESEKTKHKQAHRKCQDLQRDLVKLSQESAAHGSQTSARTIRSDIEPNKSEVSEMELKGLQEKLRQAETRMAEFRMQSQNLKQELLKTQKVLSQEVGEGISVQSLLGTNSNSNWRGRAQQIMLLQKKVGELKNQLNHQRSASKDDLDLEDEFMGGSSSGSVTGRRSNVDEKYREQLRKLDKERKESQERAQAELKALEEDYGNLKQKVDASKARHKVLSNENKSLKQQMQTLLDKGKHDDDLISALMKQQEQLRTLLDNANKLNQDSRDTSDERMKEMAMKTMQDTNVVEQLKRIVTEKETKVHALEEEIKKMRLNNLQKAQANGVSSLFDESTGPHRTLPQSDDITMSSVTPTPPSSRVGSARALSREGTLTDRLSARRPDSAKVAPVDNSIMTELQLQCQEYRSYQLTAEVERDRMNELVQLLNNRLEEASGKIVTLQNELQNQKRINVELEKQVGKAKMDQSPRKAVSGTKKSRSKTAVTVDEEKPTEMNTEEMETKLVIQSDEIEALKAALQSTLQSKKEDMHIYQQTIEETRKIFLHGLRQFKQNQNS